MLEQEVGGLAHRADNIKHLEGVQGDGKGRGLQQCLSRKKEDSHTGPTIPNT